MAAPKQNLHPPLKTGSVEQLQAKAFGFVLQAPLVHQALAMNLRQQRIRTLAVRHFAVVPAVIELRHVALQVLLANVMECADKTALQ